MSRIDLHNYEAFMLDFLEGNLSPEDVLALKAFAVLHPELELNFDEELVTLASEHEVFEGKKHLKANFDEELVIGYLENVLQGAEKKQAEELAAGNALFNHELDLYKKTIAIAETDIVFEHKEKLKRSTTIIVLPQNNYLRIAAALLLLAGLWFMASRVIKDEVNIMPELAKKTSEAANENKNASQRKLDEPTITNNANTLVAKKANNPSKTNTVTIKKELNTSTISTNGKNGEHESQLADRILIKEQPSSFVDSNTIQLSNAEKLSPKYIIEEGTDEEPVAAKPKGKLWNVAAGIFKGLNKRGIENVNGSENNNEIFIGALTISKPN